MKYVLAGISTSVSVVALLLLVAGRYSPAEYAFPVAPRIHIFVYPYGMQQDIAIANYAYTSLIDMKNVQSRHRFDGLGIHTISLKWPDFWAISLRVHLLYPVVVFALPLLLSTVGYIRDMRAK